MKEGVMDERTTDVHSLQYIHVNSTEARTSVHIGAIGGRYRSIFYELTVPS